MTYDPNTQRIIDTKLNLLDPENAGLLKLMITMVQYQQTVGAAHGPYSFRPWDEKLLQAGSDLGWLFILKGAKKLRLSKLGREVAATVARYPELTVREVKP